MAQALLQRSFDDLGLALVDATFIVVDLETTGGGPGTDRITEIGAVKVRGGEVLGEFQTLVDPGCAIPPMITVLTGITDAMVIGAPKIEEALPGFLEFARDATFVAHNASFDMRFLSYESERLGYGPLRGRSVCTVRLARRLVRDEVPNLRLATLAHALRGRTPSHRALDDARACADVFHALLELAGRWGVTHLEDLHWFQTAGGHPQARKRVLADDLPRSRGVYLFRDAAGSLLYVGKATDLRTRVRSYFGGDDRKRIGDLLKSLHAVEHHTTRLEIESAVLEARLIRKHRPPFNRAQRGKLAPGVWVRLTGERFPRVTIARTPGGIGPLPRARAAEIREALEEAAPVRRCNDRIGPSTRFDPCALAEMGRCAAPCDGRVTPEAYAESLAPILATIAGDPSAALGAMDERMARLADAQRFEEAAATRDRALSLVESLARSRGADALVAAGRLVLDAAGTTVEIAGGSLVAVAGRALPVDPDGHPDEARMLWRWVSRDRSLRVVDAAAPLALPLRGGRTLAEWLGRAKALARAR